MTSPPYWGILQKVDHKAIQERVKKGLVTDYGDDPRDLAKIESYPDFIDGAGRHLRRMSAGAPIRSVPRDHRR